MADDPTIITPADLEQVRAEYHAARDEAAKSAQESYALQELMRKRGQAHAAAKDRWDDLCKKFAEQAISPLLDKETP